MAKKRLNKKVAIIGSLIIGFLMVLAILLILRLNRDSEKYLLEGDVALAAAQAAEDETVKKEEYAKALRNYGQAHSLSKRDPEKIRALYKIADVKQQIDEWIDVVKCWAQIVRIDDQQTRARYSRLKYVYLMADSGLRTAWQEVLTQASDFIDIAEGDAQVLEQETSQLDPFGPELKTNVEGKLATFLYLVRGRAFLETAQQGRTVDQGKMLEQAIDDFQHVREIEPYHVIAAGYHARAILIRGELHAATGDSQAKNREMEHAKSILVETVDNRPNSPRAYINLVSMKLALARNLDFNDLEQQYSALESEYLGVVKKFPESAEAYSVLAAYYHSRLKGISKAVAAAVKAVELDKDNVIYARNAADFYYTNFSIHGEKEWLNKAIDTASHALELPGAQDKPGPRQWANRMQKVSINAFLSRCYLDLIIEDRVAQSGFTREQLLEKAEQTVDEIEELIGTGDDMHVVKWKGMLNLAKGQKTIAVKQLNSAYEQLKSVGQRDSLLSYRLAKQFENSSELGAVLEFYTSALGINNRKSRDLIDNSKPESLLEYARILMKLRSYNLALGAVDYYEKKFSANQSSQRTLVELNILIGQYDKAQEVLDSMQPDDVNRLQLNLELAQARVGRLQNAIVQKRLKENTLTVFDQEDKRQLDPVQEESLEQITEQLSHYRIEWAKLTRELLAKEPNSIDENHIVALCNNYISENKITEAQSLVEQFLKSHPDNTSIEFYKQMLLEPDPRTISEQRRRQIEEDVLSTISDPARRSMNLARLYHKYNEMDKASQEFKKVLKLQVAPLDVDSPEGLTAQAMRQLAASYAFEIALTLKDWVDAEQLTELSRKENLDDCQGRFFVARLALAKGEFEKALTELDECLKLRPVFSHAHLLKSNAYAALGNYYDAAQEAHKAASLNPQDGTIAKSLAFLLHSRNQNLGEKVTTEQLTETKKALLKATALNPQDLQLLSFYAEYISGDNPAQALAIRQRLQQNVPNVENTLLLARMAMRMALAESLEQRKEALFEIAASSFRQAREIDPNNRTVLESMADYHRVRGEADQAEDLLTNSGDKQLLWNYYLRSGRYDEAKSTLQQLYQDSSKDISVLRGLLFIAERELNREDVKKYSEELLIIKDNPENRLLQIQTFLKSGLVNDVEPKLQSFKEKYAQDPRALLLEAWLAMRQGQLEKALDLINRSLSLSEDENALAWQLRGRVNYLLGKSQQAIDDFKKSKSLNSDPTTRFLLARAYLKAGLNQDALTELQNTIDHPHAPSGVRDLMEQVYLNSADKDALRRFYSQTLEKLDDSIDWHNRAGAFAVSEGDFDRAVALYGKALQIAIDRQQSPAMGTGNNRFMVSDYSAALDGYLHALLMAAGSSSTNIGSAKLNRLFEVGSKFVDSKLPSVSAVAFLGMADAKMKINERQSALEYYKKAMDKAFGSKDRKFARRTLQRVDSAIGREAVTNYCSGSLKANPESASANMAMFFLMNLSEQYNKSLQYIDKCLSLSTSDRNERLFYSVQKANTLEAAYNKTSDSTYLGRIIAEYESLLSEMPKNIVVLNNLAYILSLKNERLQDALEYSRRAHESAPDNPGFMDTYGYVLYKNNKLQEADEYLQAALQQYLQDRISAPAEVYEHLGMVKEALGHKAEAVEAYEQALSIGKESLSEAARERIKTAIKRVAPGER
ncbi:MAG: tetratricopeptide repeat protein [Planctomycetota bacterium]|jgi:tetratricopeptide (TPR) repeat protein